MNKSFMGYITFGNKVRNVCTNLCSTFVAKKDFCLFACKKGFFLLVIGSCEVRWLSRLYSLRCLCAMF